MLGAKDRGRCQDFGATWRPDDETVPGGACCSWHEPVAWAVPYRCSFKIAEWDDDSQRYIDCPPLSLRQLAHLHQVQDVDETLRNLNYKEVHGWVLQDIEKYQPPRRYKHTSGCVSWVRLTGTAPAAKEKAAARPMKRPGKCQR
eukprot:s1724_g9.t1